MLPSYLTFRNPVPGNKTRDVSCPSLCTIAVIKNKSYLGRSGFISLVSFWSTVRKELRIGTEVRNLRAGTEAVIIEDHGLLACVLWLIQPLFLYNSGSCRGGGWVGGGGNDFQ